MTLSCGIHAIGVDPSFTHIATGGGSPNDITVFSMRHNLLTHNQHHSDQRNSDSGTHRTSSVVPCLTPELVLEGHTDWIFACVFLSETVLASASRDASVRLWDATYNNTTASNPSCRGCSVSRFFSSPTFNDATATPSTTTYSSNSFNCSNYNSYHGGNDPNFYTFNGGYDHDVFSGDDDDISTYDETEDYRGDVADAAGLSGGSDDNDSTMGSPRLSISTSPEDEIFGFFGGLGSSSSSSSSLSSPPPPSVLSSSPPPPSSHYHDEQQEEVKAIYEQQQQQRQRQQQQDVSGPELCCECSSQEAQGARTCSFRSTCLSHSGSAHWAKVRDLKYDNWRNQLASLGTDGTVNFWNPTVSLQLLSSVRLPFHEDAVCMAVDPTRNIFSIGSQKAIMGVDPRVPHLVHCVSVLDTFGVRSLSARNDILTVGGGSGNLFFFDSRKLAYIPTSNGTDHLSVADGYTAKDAVFYDVFGGISSPQALYTHQYSMCGNKLFVAGGPLPFGLRGSLASIFS